MSSRSVTLVCAITICLGGCGDPVIEGPDVTQTDADVLARNIVFIRTTAGDARVHTVASGGGTPFDVSNRLAPSFSDDGDASWSPDGTKILFSSDRSGNREIFWMKADGKVVTQLTSNSSADYSAVYSPNGSKIAYVHEVPGARPQIHVMNADGSGDVNISNNTYNEISPSWSPDGTQLVYASDRDAKYGANTYLEIYKMNSNGSGVTRLTFNDDGIDYFPTWSPDGTKIAFTTHRAANTLHCYDFALEIWVMNSDGSAPHNVSNHCNGDAMPAWSRDGTKIIFVSDRSQATKYAWDLWVMGADGGGATRLTTAGTDVLPRWRPTAP